MKKQEFEEAYIKNSGITLEFYRKHFVTLPCNCGYHRCMGWACVSKNKESIKTHKELYGG